MFYEFETPQGLEELASRQLESCLAVTSGDITRRAPGVLSSPLAPNDWLASLGLVSSVWLVLTCAGRRPTALLGQQFFERCRQELQKLCRSQKFSSLRLSAAGSQTATMQRIASELSEAAGLELDIDQGDLLIRIRPSLYEQGSWDLLIRITPRPLSVRDWRVSSFPGALNACLACGMLELAELSKECDTLHLMCGSGTTAIEHALRYPYRTLTAGDISQDQLEMTQRNSKSAGVDQEIELFHLDAREMSFERDSFNAVICNLPWGERVGNREANMDLYRAVISEVERVLRPSGRAVFLTQHDEALLSTVDEERFLLQRKTKVSQRGFHPILLLLEKI